MLPCLMVSAGLEWNGNGRWFVLVLFIASTRMMLPSPELDSTLFYTNSVTIMSQTATLLC